MSTSNYHLPESVEELEALVAEAHARRTKLRPVGSGLSPNGLGFCEGGMVNLALCDRVLSVDAERGRVTLQAGARLEVALAALRQHGWTLQNFSSIKEQQVAGWTQAGCHGTGARLPPVEETIVSLKLVTPAKGTLLLDGAENNPALFHLAKLSLGTLGVVAEVTLQGVRSHQLVERTAVLPSAQVRSGHAARLRRHRHVRYMWLPYTDCAVVVTADPLEAVPPTEAVPTPLAPEAQRTRALRELLARCDSSRSASEDEKLGFGELRDLLLQLHPLSSAHVAAVNEAERQFWAASCGVRVGDSEAILGFDCGGEQLVCEVAFPTGTLARNSGADLDVAQAALAWIRREGVAAPAPLEQRWSCGSAAPLSPAHGGSPASASELHSWLGIIMYLPPSDAGGETRAHAPSRREAVAAAFEAYKRGLGEAVFARVGAREHWAKIEVPKGEAELMALRRRLAASYGEGLQALNAARLELDPHNVLGNELVDALLPRTRLPPPPTRTSSSN